MNGYEMKAFVEVVYANSGCSFLAEVDIEVDRGLFETVTKGEAKPKGFPAHFSCRLYQEKLQAEEKPQLSSWFSLEEFEDVIQRYRKTCNDHKNVRLEAVAAMMRTVKEGGFGVRLIYWFESEGGENALNGASR